MATNGKPSAVPKNKVRTALVTAATVATLMGAQTLAFSQNQQATSVVVNMQPTDQQPIIMPTLVPSLTPTVTTSPTSSVKATQVNASSTPAASPTATATQVSSPTLQPTKVVPAVQQPAPSTRSSRR